MDLSGKRALIVGVANDQSIAWGCARAFSDAGARLAVTYLNEKAEKHVRPLAARLEADLIAPLDVAHEAQMDDLFDRIGDLWGGLDVVLHAVAFCPKDDLHGRVVDVSRDGFATAMQISVHSFLGLIRRAEPLMPDGGACMTVSFYGAEKVVDHYNVMGPVKAALESATRYAAAELGPKRITVNALSPGPMATRAASGIDHFDELMAAAADRAPTHHLATLEEVGAYAAFLASDAARSVTGGVHYVDGGYNIVG